MAETITTGVSGYQFHGGGGEGEDTITPRRRHWHGVCTIPKRKWSNCSTLDGGGAGTNMVVHLVGAFNQLRQRMSSSSTINTSEELVFQALKLSIPLLRSLPPLPGGRSPLSRALSVALLLADLQMDAELISAALLLQPLLSNAISLPLLRPRLASATAHLLHDSLRLSATLRNFKQSQSDNDYADLRRFCLTFYDSRALALEAALALDSMTHHLRHLPRFQQHVLSLRTLNIHAPLAHALGLSQSLSLPLEDLAFRCLFPFSYLFLDAWLKTHNADTPLESYKERLLRALEADPLLSEMASRVRVGGRYKSRYSTMKKILKDGRRPHEVNDVIGLRVVVDGEEGACYRAAEVVRCLWKEVATRTKDYIARPKANGYRSLHMAVDVAEEGEGGRPLMEIQIRTVEMESLAASGDASHSFYKAGLADPQQAKRLKAIMVAAAELAALRLKDSDDSGGKSERDRVFRLLDKNGDGRISMEELKEVMEELGAPGEDARRMMNMLDSNSDGSLSSDEFDNFQRQVDFMLTVEQTDGRYKTLLNDKLH